MQKLTLATSVATFNDTCLILATRGNTLPSARSSSVKDAATASDAAYSILSVIMVAPETTAPRPMPCKKEGGRKGGGEGGRGGECMTRCTGAGSTRLSNFANRRR